MLEINVLIDISFQLLELFLTQFRDLLDPKLFPLLMSLIIVFTKESELLLLCQFFTNLNTFLFTFFIHFLRLHLY